MQHVVDEVLEVVVTQISACAMGNTTVNLPESLKVVVPNSIVKLVIQFCSHKGTEPCLHVEYNDAQGKDIVS